MTLCPCRASASFTFLSQPIAYSDCCQPYHDNLLNDEATMIRAETAERLMRSRYSAFVLVKPEYIVKTTVPAQQALLDIEAIETWAQQTPWAGLEIVAHTPQLGKRHAQVEFKAYYATQEGAHAAHHELSSFVRIKDKANHETWYFLDPTVAMNISQKQPCLCGSGEKFKRCCGRYL